MIEEPNIDIYFVCFPPGTGGRFVSNIIWHLVNDLQKPITFSDFNSSHVNEPWAQLWVDSFKGIGNMALTDYRIKGIGPVLSR